MITLLQQSNYLIGSVQDIEALKSIEQARLLTVSDSHGDYRNLIRIIKQFGPGCNALLLLGDCYKDLGEVLEKANEDEEFKKTIPSVIAFVKGNGDPQVFPVSYDIGKNNSEARTLLKGSVLMPSELIINVNHQNIYLAHGHQHGVDFGYNKFGLEAKLNNCKYAVHGHTHVPTCQQIDDFTFINPGSISRPRGGMPASFAILTVDEKFIDTAFLKINDPFGTNSSYTIFNPIC